MKRFILQLKWGILFSIATLLWLAFEKLMGWHDIKIREHATNTLYFFIPAILVYYLAITEIKEKSFDGIMNVKRGLISGLIIGILIALLAPLTQYIFHTYISPKFFLNAIEFAVEDLEKPYEEMEAYFNLNNYIYQSMISAPILGLITGGIFGGIYQIFNRK